METILYIKGARLKVLTKLAMLFCNLFDVRESILVLLYLIL
jgi:hypothetical protein